MRHEIVFAPLAVEDLSRLRAFDRAAVLAAIEKHLRHAPQRTSRSRIKRLRGLRKPQFRLRVGEARVFYDVVPGGAAGGAPPTVAVLAIVAKSDAEDWLARFGENE